MLILEIVILVAAALIAIWSEVGAPPKPILWVSNILLCVLIAILLVGGR